MLVIKRFAVLVTFALLFTPFEGHAQAPAQWSWFRATTAAKDWWITTGRADVTISGTTFTATLWDDQSPNFARLSINGTIRSDAVNAKVTINNTDGDPFRLSGKLRRTCWEGGGGRESLVLSDGWEVVGLFRELHGGRCVPTR